MDVYSPVGAMKHYLKIASFLFVSTEVALF